MFRAYRHELHGAYLHTHSVRPLTPVDCPRYDAFPEFCRRMAFLRPPAFYHADMRVQMLPQARGCFVAQAPYE